MANRPDEKYVAQSWREALRVLQAMTPHERQLHFNMREWGRKTDCGTVMCIAGYCSVDPWFNENRGIKGTWNGELLAVDYGEFMRVFGHDWQYVFMNDNIETHADAVRAVLRRLTEHGEAAPCPLGFGMP